jgi:hypothetical protein
VLDLDRQRYTGTVRRLKPAQAIEVRQQHCGCPGGRALTRAQMLGARFSPVRNASMNQSAARP